MTIRERIDLLGTLLWTCDYARVKEIAAERGDLIDGLPRDEAQRIYDETSTDALFAPIFVKLQYRPALPA